MPTPPSRSDRDASPASVSRRSFLRRSASASLLSGIPLPDGWLRAARSNADVDFYEARDAGHEERRGLFNRRIDKRPAVIAVCHRPDGVHTALELARQRGLAVAVRSGGHSFEGFSSNDGGLVVDLSQMQLCHLDPDDQVLTTRPAATIAQLLRCLLPEGRILPMGSCGGVGIGGLTLGGGYGMFSRSLGLSCDHLERVRMIDGRGEVVDSIDTPELLWACRGGGNGNFGVVTNLVFRTHPAPKVFESTVLKAYDLDPARAVRLAERWFEVGVKLPRSAFSAFVLNGSTLTVLVTNTEAAAREALELALNRLAAGMDRRDATRSGALTEASLSRYYGRAEPLWFKNASAGYYRGFEDLASHAEEMFRRVISARGVIFQVNTLGGAIAETGDAGSAAYPHRAYPFLGELQCYPNRPGQEDEGVAVIEALQGLLHEAGIRAHYRNYPDAGLKNWGEAYYGRESWARLRRLKRRFDPDDLIRHPQSVPLES